MRLLLVLFGLLLASPTLAQNIRTSPSAQHLPGTGTNDSANPGELGEYVSAVVPGDNATVTITIASPAVVTWTAHNYVGQPTNTTTGARWAAAIEFTTTGALPTGLTAGQTYYVIGSTATTNTFQVASSVANALAGTAINTSGTQSGVQTGTARATMATNTAKDIGGYILTPGDWTFGVTGVFTGNAATTVGTLYMSSSLVSNTINSVFPTAVSQVIVSGDNLTTFGVTGQQVYSGMQIKLSVVVNTTIFLVGQCNFGINSCLIFGGISARRAR